MVGVIDIGGYWSCWFKADVGACLYLRPDVCMYVCGVLCIDQCCYYWDLPMTFQRVGAFLFDLIWFAVLVWVVGYVYLPNFALYRLALYLHTRVTLLIICVIIISSPAG